MKLVLGCGAHHKKETGEYLVDRFPFPGVDCVHDLDLHPWPLNGPFSSISALHLVEHLKTLLVPFMDECHRLLEPGGLLCIETPLAGGDIDIEWCDPTHVRCYRRHSFLNYFTPEGIAQFGYTTRAWEFPFLREHYPIRGVLTVHARPIQPS